MPGATAAQVRGCIVRITLPCVLDEACGSVGGFDRCADAVLQAGEVIADEVDVGDRGHVAIIAVTQPGTPKKGGSDCSPPLWDSIPYLDCDSNPE